METDDAPIVRIVVDSPQNEKPKREHSPSKFDSGKRARNEGIQPDFGPALFEEKKENVKVEISDDWTRQEPIETPSMFEAYKDKLRAKYQSCFSGEGDYDYFCMLPIPDHLKAEFVTKLQHNSRQTVVI